MIKNLALTVESKALAADLSLCISAVSSGAAANYSIAFSELFLRSTNKRGLYHQYRSLS